jgi:THAP domain
VPNCRGNYSREEKSRVFSFPKDENLRRKWISAICRVNFQPTAHSRVSIVTDIRLNELLKKKRQWNNIVNQILYPKTLYKTSNYNYQLVTKEE